MKNILPLVFSLFLFSVSLNTQAQGAFISQALYDKIEQSDSNELIPIMLLLNDQVDLNALKEQFEEQNIHPHERAKIVNARLRQKAEFSQKAVISAIENFGSSHYAEIRTLWIANIIILSADKLLIEELVSNTAIDKIDYNKANIRLIEPVKVVDSPAKSEDGIEPGLAAINAPALWAMGYTGQGRIAYSVDTGIWPDHPTYSDRFLPNLMPYSSTWFAYDSEFPMDKESSHGSHTMGTVLGLEHENNDTIGVAFNAYFIASDPVVSDLADVKPLTDFMFAYEWALDPDGDPETSTDIPDVINNSWGFGPDLDEAPCPDFVIPVFNAVEAAGIANVFSAGNEGPEEMTMSVPHNTNTGLVNSFTVGAVNTLTPTYFIADFSSRGPSICGGEGSLLIKPEVSAPGVAVRSSVENGEYDSYSGTSMAAPHVTGAVLLLKEAFPFLSGEEILLALYYSATDMGDIGEDNTYGMGMINVEAAFNFLAANNTPIPPSQPDTDIRILSILNPANGFLCSDKTVPQIAVKNTGVNDISDITVNMQMDGGTISIESFEIDLSAGEEIILDMPGIMILDYEKHELHVWIDELPEEFDVLNNNAVSRFERLASVSYPLSEGFENGIPVEWKVINEDNSIGWDTIPTIGLPGSVFSAWIKLFNYNQLSQKDYLLFPKVAIPQDGPTYLSFVYSYRKKSSVPIYQDTLAVVITENCAVDMIEDLFREAGADLYTNTENQNDAFPESAEDWRAVSIDLSEFAGEELRLAFESVNRSGNNLFIDNVNISGTPLSINSKNTGELGFNLFPNPAGDEIYIELNNSKNEGFDLKICDINGRIIKILNMKEEGNKLSIPVRGLSPGVYIITVTGKHSTGSQRFVKL